MAEKERTTLTLDDEEEVGIDLAVLATRSSENKRTASLDKTDRQQAVKESVKDTAFNRTSQSKPTKQRRKTSPYKEQKGFRVRPAVLQIFIDLVDNYDGFNSDSQTLELALQALLEKTYKRETGETKSQIKSYLTELNNIRKNETGWSEQKKGRYL